MVVEWLIYLVELNLWLVAFSWANQALTHKYRVVLVAVLDLDLAVFDVSYPLGGMPVECIDVLLLDVLDPVPSAHPR